MKSATAWESVRPPRLSNCRKRARYDVIIVGGGITGLTAAYLLKQAGRNVCLLEKSRPASVGDTSRTTAHLTYVTDRRLSDLAVTFGEEGARLAWEAGAAAIDRIETIVKELSIDCEFRRVPGFLSAPWTNEEHAGREQAKREVETLNRDADLARKLGFPAVFMEIVPHFQHPGIRFPDQAKFHPLKYCAALVQAIAGEGCDVFDHSEASKFQANPIRVEVNGVELKADYLVLATNVPLMGNSSLAKATMLQTKIFPYSSYAIGAKLPPGSLPEACFWDTSDPYYYLRVDRRPRYDYVIFGGEDHKTGQADNTEDSFTKLEAALRRLLPQGQPERRWSGQVIETNDGLPYIGETASQQFAASGFSGNGMTFGTIAAVMARDAVVGRNNPWSKLFAIERKKIRGGLWDYLVENVDFPFYYIKDRLSRAEAKSTRSVKRGKGKIVELNGERVAASRDDDGKLCELSPYCTHMGCIVRWNASEKSWDCPCHGSRFKPTGEVVAGPAETPLESLRKSANKG